VRLLHNSGSMRILNSSPAGSPGRPTRGDLALTALGIILLHAGRHYSFRMGRVAAAYQRGDLLAKRRRLMDRWGSIASPVPTLSRCGRSRSSRCRIKRGRVLRPLQHPPHLALFRLPIGAVGIIAPRADVLPTYVAAWRFANRKASTAKSHLMLLSARGD
jgi:hypothetical protein